VIENDFRCGKYLQARRHILAVDADAVARVVTIAGLRRPTIEQHAPFQHPFLELATRAEPMLGEKLVETFGHLFVFGPATVRVADVTASAASMVRSR
jgi:hypothetical protein